MNHSRRILVIDDETNVREVIRVCLESFAGWEVIVAASGQEGLERAIATRPDVILLDRMMPGMDGMAVLRALQADPALRSIPVIWASSNLSLFKSEEVNHSNVMGAIEKPFDPLTLAAQIAQILGWEL